DGEAERRYHATPWAHEPRGPASIDPPAYSDGVRTVNAGRVPETTGSAPLTSEHVLHLEADVVAVADRPELAGGCALDARVVEDEPEGVADELHARLDDDRLRPGVEGRERGHLARAGVGRRDEQGLKEAIVGQAIEPWAKRTGMLVARGAAAGLEAGVQALRDLVDRSLRADDRRLVAD